MLCCTREPRPPTTAGARARPGTPAGGRGGGDSNREPNAKPNRVYIHGTMQQRPALRPSDGSRACDAYIYAMPLGSIVLTVLYVCMYVVTMTGASGPRSFKNTHRKGVALL